MFVFSRFLPAVVFLKTAALRFPLLEAFADDFGDVAEDQERGRVDGAHEALQLHGLAAREDDHDHLHGRAAVGALGGHERGRAVEAVHDEAHDLVRFAADDHDLRAAVERLDHPVDDNGLHVEAERAHEDALEVDGHEGQHEDADVDVERRRADVHAPAFFRHGGRHVHAAGGSAFAEEDAHAEAADDAAEQSGQDRVADQRIAEHFEQRQRQGGEQRVVQRPERKARRQGFPAPDEQQRVAAREHPDGRNPPEVVGDQADAGHAGAGELIGFDQRGDTEADEQRADGDVQKRPQLPPAGRPKRQPADFQPFIHGHAPLQSEFNFNKPTGI